MDMPMTADGDSAPTEAITFDSTSRFAQTPKWKLHYNEVGSGHPIILLHGSGPGATGWTNFSPNIAELGRHYRVIALDMPGWGRSDPLDPLATPTVPAAAEAVRDLMDVLGLEKAALVGNSLGGMVALHFAESYNDRLSHLITMGSGIVAVPTMFAPAGLSEGLRILIETYRDPSVANFRRLVQIMVFNASFVTDELLMARSDAALANPKHLENWLKPFAKPGGMPVNGDSLATLSKIATPSLFIHGRDDRVVSMEHSLRLVSVVPNSRLHVFNRCGHWVQIEHAKEFNALVSSFLTLT